MLAGFASSAALSDSDEAIKIRQAIMVKRTLMLIEQLDSVRTWTMSEQVLIRQPQCAKIFHHSHGIFALGNLGQAIARETGFVQAVQQTAEGIFVQIQI